MKFLQQKSKESVIAEFTPKSETEYTVTCKINENSKCIFELKIFCGSRDEAKRIVDNWKTNAYKIYPEMLSTLNKTFKYKLRQIILRKNSLSLIW